MGKQLDKSKLRKKCSAKNWPGLFKSVNVLKGDRQRERDRERESERVREKLLK